MPYYTYLLISEKDKKWYTGCTGDLKRRMLQHNNSDKYPMKFRKPFKLIYYEVCLDSRDAFTREKYLKSGMGKRFLKNRLKNFLRDLSR